jgi:hypothetical protein
MDKHQKDVKGNQKATTHSKDDNSKGMMKGDKATDMKADDKKDVATKTENKKVSATHAK